MPYGDCTKPGAINCTIGSCERDKGFTEWTHEAQLQYDNASSVDRDYETGNTSSSTTRAPGPAAALEPRLLLDSDNV